MHTYSTSHSCFWINWFRIPYGYTWAFINLSHKITTCLFNLKVTFVIFSDPVLLKLIKKVISREVVLLRIYLIFNVCKIPQFCVEIVNNFSLSKVIFQLFSWEEFLKSLSITCFVIISPGTGGWTWTWLGCNQCIQETSGPCKM